MGVSTKENMRCSLSKYGVITYDDFFVPLVGENYKNLAPLDFLYTPSNYLADASNGEVFFDGNGEFSRIREQIKNGMPEDMRLKKLAGRSCRNGSVPDNITMPAYFHMERMPRRCLLFVSL